MSELGDKIIKGMKQAVAHAEGEDTDSIVHEPDLKDVDPRAVRTRLGFTQEEFARFLGISVHTLRKWEQGQRKPEGPARVLLQVVDREPEAVLRALHESEGSRAGA